jgi:hypothetical protein
LSPALFLLTTIEGTFKKRENTLVWNETHKMKIRLRNARSFLETGSLPIAPITLLVGENSTGKTSFLALYRIAIELARGNLNPNFNKDPFNLGAYDQIAHYRGGKYGRSKSFEIEVEFPLRIIMSSRLRRSESKLPEEARLEFKFGEINSQPRLVEYKFSAGPYTVVVNSTDKKWPVMEFSTPSGRGGVSPKMLRRYIPFYDEDAMASVIRSIMYFGRGFRPFNPTQYSGEKNDLLVLAELWDVARKSIRHEPYAFAPVRSSPKRTYDPVDSEPESEGGHVPMVLQKTFISNRAKWLKLKEAMDSFGKASGMFDQISLKSLGLRKSGSDPFQVMVKIAGPASNMIDVGYGVSQVLPLIVDLVEQNKPKTYLMQQPEIHLHPRAQAELGTFLASFVRSSRSRLIVETHSDFLVDRIRMEARRNKLLTPKDVSIMFFERKDLEVKISQITLDEEGNLDGAPSTYRSFFLKETNKLLGL